MNNNILAQVKGLSKKYNDCTAVDNISFSIKKGEIFALLGQNGAGKTTTIKMLCGLLKADTGEIMINGLDVSKNYKHIKTMIGLCPQEIIIWESLTCFEQLQFTGMSYGMTYKTAKKKANDLLDILELSDKRNKLAKTLSGGMKRRINIALALVHDPKLIILDEPQAGLDPQSRILVRDFIRELAKDRAVLLTTHDMDEADRLSDRIGIIDHGKILVIGSPEEIKKSSGIRDVLQINVRGISIDLINKIMDLMPPELTEKKYLDEFIFLSGNNLIKLIPTVINTFETFNLQVKDIVIRKRTLEDAFISMTGRRLHG